VVQIRKYLLIEILRAQLRLFLQRKQDAQTCDPPGRGTRFRKVEDRKYFIDGNVKDSLGTILATAEALWIQPKLSGKL